MTEDETLTKLHDLLLGPEKLTTWSDYKIENDYLSKARDMHSVLREEVREMKKAKFLVLPFLISGKRYWVEDSLRVRAILGLL